ncbi:hypothetical protein RUM44_012027 [Polyplax serrata]|uniref:KASH domain-containing protein n=1 Tax=Polyplax serrata TaxID=468196 RepID=A0ABR1BEJ7_POLSC
MLTPEEPRGGYTVTTKEITYEIIDGKKQKPRKPGKETTPGRDVDEPTKIITVEERITRETKEKPKDEPKAPKKPQEVEPKGKPKDDQKAPRKPEELEPIGKPKDEPMAPMKPEEGEPKGKPKDEPKAPNKPEEVEPKGKPKDDQKAPKKPDEKPGKDVPTSVPEPKTRKSPEDDKPKDSRMFLEFERTHTDRIEPSIEEPRGGYTVTTKEITYEIIDGKKQKPRKPGKETTPGRDVDEPTKIITVEERITRETKDKPKDDQKAPKKPEEVEPNGKPKDDHKAPKKPEEVEPIGKPKDEPMAPKKPEEGEPKGKPKDDHKAPKKPEEVEPKSKPKDDQKAPKKPEEGEPKGKPKDEPKAPKKPEEVEPKGKPKDDQKAPKKPDEKPGKDVPTSVPEPKTRKSPEDDKPKDKEPRGGYTVTTKEITYEIIDGKKQKPRKPGKETTPGRDVDEPTKIITVEERITRETKDKPKDDQKAPKKPEEVEPKGEPKDEPKGRMKPEEVEPIGKPNDDQKAPKKPMPNPSAWDVRKDTFANVLKKDLDDRRNDTVMEGPKIGVDSVIVSDEKNISLVRSTGTEMSNRNEDEAQGHATSIAGAIVSFGKRVFGFPFGKKSGGTSSDDVHNTPAGGILLVPDEETTRDYVGNDGVEPNEPSIVGWKIALEKPEDTQSTHPAQISNDFPVPVDQQSKELRMSTGEPMEENNKPSAPSYSDLFTQTSTPESSPRKSDTAHKLIQTVVLGTNEEGIQTDSNRDKGSVLEYPVQGLPRVSVTEKFQQTGPPNSADVADTTLRSQRLPETMTPTELSKKNSRESGKESASWSEEWPIESGELKSGDEPLDVYVTAKVSVTQPDTSDQNKRSKNIVKNNRGGGVEYPMKDNQGNFKTPKDFIVKEKQFSTINIGVVPTPETEISINVSQDKPVTDFIETERKATEEANDSPKDQKDDRKKDKREKKSDGGKPMRKHPNELTFDDTALKKPGKGDTIGIDVSVQLDDKPTTAVETCDTTQDDRSIMYQIVRREKEKRPDDGYNVSVDVKVKSGESPTQKFLDDSRRSDVGITVPSPRRHVVHRLSDGDDLDPEQFVVYLRGASDAAKDRLKKIRSIKNQPRTLTTWMLSSAPEEPITSEDIHDGVKKLKDALGRGDYIQIQRIFIYLNRNIDDWLNTVQYRIALNRADSTEGPNRDKVSNLKSLKEEVNQVKEYLNALNKISGPSDSDIIRRLTQHLQDLEPQIMEMQRIAEEEEGNAARDLKRWEEFLNGVNNLSVIVEENNQNMGNVVDSDGSPATKVEELDKIDSTNRDHMNRAFRLIKQAKDLAKDYPNQEIPPDAYTTYEKTKNIQNNLNAERDRLLQLLSLTDEYEQTLKEFAQIIEVAENLVESPIVISSLQHLQDEMQKHRKFFVNLSHCRDILESLESNLDGETRGIHNQLHGKLHEKASSILDKAASRAQQMAMAASRWTLLDKRVRNEQQWLQVVHQRLPDLQQVMSSDYDQYISLHQSLASDTAVHHAKILQLMDVANKLQDVITCAGFENFYKEYLNVILKLQEEIGSSLDKLLAFRSMWTLYELTNKRLNTWMKSAEQDLKSLKAVSGRASMRQFWELKAQFEVHNRLRDEMGNNFEKAVQLLPIADEMTQRQILGKLENRWKKLEKEMKGIQDSVTATLSAEGVPVNEKLKLLEDELNELNDTVDDLHGIIKTSEELNLYIGRLQILIERLDTIQEELGGLGLLPAAESEKVGYLLNLGSRLEHQLLQELNEARLLRDKLLGLQKGIEKGKRNQYSVSSILDECGSAEKLMSEVVAQGVNTCENVSDELKEQWQDLMTLRQVLHNLPTRLRLSVSPIKVEREISQLQETHTVLEERCAGLLSRLKQRLSLWKKYEKQLENVHRNIQETDYMVELLTLQGSVDLERLQTATDRLKNLQNSVGQREGLIAELRRLAEPLTNSCDPEVAAQLNAQVDEAVIAWNDTRKNLYNITNKYKGAVNLWKKYREGRDDIRRWIEHQWGNLDLLQDKPEAVLPQIKECKETLANQKARLDELKKLVAQIAADIGLDAGGFLECEVEDLDKRLADVKETLSTLTSAAESNIKGKDICKDELIKAKKFLGSVQNSLNIVGKDETENSLATLRDNLLALGKTESQVQNLKEKSIHMNDKPHEIKSESSVVEILELWQQVFQETFQQYYRLSAKLVRSQDGAAALRLWQEYLRHVQTFLAGSLPEDYDGLREAERLCEVHQNLLTSQQSVLASRQDPMTKDFTQVLQEQFNSLANLHNETLARIMDRHNEVNKRLQMWDIYRHDQSRVLAWLRDMNRDQSRLQLRYIHLRRLPKLLEQINLLLTRIPQGRGQIQDLQKQQEGIAKFCDEALATSIKMESVATAERINNLEASLKSWKDFLNRVQDLNSNYELELDKVDKVCDEITKELSSPAPVSFSAIQSRLDLCRALKDRVSNLSKKLEEANVTYDQLKECLSPHDLKRLCQRLWLITQRQGDLEHHLLLQILWLEDHLETQQSFNLQHGRFMTWANDLIQRFHKNSAVEPTNKFLDIDTRTKRLETEVQVEMNLKNREYNALHSMANNIIHLSKDSNHTMGKMKPASQNRIDYEIMKADVERKIKEIDDVWDQLKNLKVLRLERKSKLITTMQDLLKRMEDMKTWLGSVEQKIDEPVVFEKNNKKCLDKLVKDHEVIQEDIEKQSGNVGEVLNLCELFLADPAVDGNGIDTSDFELTQKALEKRWKSVCLSSTERKNRIINAWELLLQLTKICKDQEKWVGEREKALENLVVQMKDPKVEVTPKVMKLADKEKQEIDSKDPALKILDATYSKFAQDSRLPTENVQLLAGPAKTLLNRWHLLYDKLKDITNRSTKVNKLRDEFLKNHNNAVVMLTNISAKLIQAELVQNPKKRIRRVNDLEKELERENEILRKADESGLELMKICPEEQGNSSPTQMMIDEYQLLWRELRDRFQSIKRKHQESVESKEIQVSTLPLGAEVQVDTLPHMERLTSRDAYGLELDVALRECEENLRGFETILNAEDGDSDTTVPTHSTLARIIATCTSSIELVQHLNQALLELEMSDRDARTPQVKELTHRFNALLPRAKEREQQLREASERGRLTCPICSRRNWQQLENDLWRLEQWIQYAEAIQNSRPSLPSRIEALEDIIQDHKELIIDLDSHKSIVVALNIVGDHLADHVDDVEKARILRQRLKGLNTRWDKICGRASQWQKKLQKALIENPEFHDTIDDLVRWMENTESVIRNSEPVDLSQDKIIIESQYRKYKVLSRELERCEPRVQSLQDAAVQVLDNGASTRQRLNALRLRLIGLRRLIKVYLLRLGAVLGSESTEALEQALMSFPPEMLAGAEGSEVPSTSTAQADGDGYADTTRVRRGLRFLGRVFRASLPFQALMLLILGAATLVPDEYYSCAFSNKARLQPYYLNGPPPV